MATGTRLIKRPGEVFAIKASSWERYRCSLHQIKGVLVTFKETKHTLSDIDGADGLRQGEALLLTWADVKMLRREIFVRVGSKDDDSTKNGISRIVVMFDQVHDLLSVLPKARAAGIHLFLITQRPDKDALPGLIKANMNNKIALKVSNRLNSQIILDEPGAEGLLGQGHMIAKLANQPGGMIYAQAPYLDPEDAAAVAAAIAQG